MVNIKTIDAKVLSRMFLAGAKNLEAKKEWINELNVFPVPDGDTGTNMLMTLQNGYSAISCDFGVFVRGGDLRSFYSPILSPPLPYSVLLNFSPFPLFISV